MSSSVKVLYFSGYEWDDRWRRKQRLAYELAQQAEVASVLYINPPVQTSVLDLLRGRFQPSHLGNNRVVHKAAVLGRPRKVAERVWVYTGSTKTLPLTKLDAMRKNRTLQRLNHWLYVRAIQGALRHLPGEQLLLWLCLPSQAFALDAFPQRVLSCYDWTDDWLEYEHLFAEDARKLASLNDRILREVDVVFAVSQHLYGQAAAVNPNTYEAPNATDMDVIGQETNRNLPPAPELSDLPRPIVGYIGQIGDKIDYDLIDFLAQTRPNWSFVFIGNVWPNHRDQVNSLQRLPNVHFLGRRAYHDLPAFLRGFDVCVLPHLCNALTRSMDPIKLYDYLASGKPIVSTPVAGVERFPDAIYVADTSQEFISQLEQAVQENSILSGKRQSYARENTWPRRGADMWAVLKSHLKHRGLEL